MSLNELISHTGFEVQRYEGILRMTMVLLSYTGIPVNGIRATGVVLIEQKLEHLEEIETTCCGA